MSSPIAGPAGPTSLSRPRLDVVIVTWNAGPTLGACLRALADRLAEAGQPRDGVRRVTVIDNASHEAATVPAGLASVVEVVCNDTNRGFAAACNQGARRGSGEFVLFLNPDVLLGPGALHAALHLLSAPANRHVGIVGLQLRDTCGAIARTSARRPRPASFMAALLRLPSLWPARFHGHLMTDWDHATTRRVDHVTGACYLVRRSLFEALGGFDERFFVYFEDLDFSLRARDAGWDIVYLATAQAVHPGGWSTGRGRPTRLYHDWRSRVAFARKHFGPLTAAVVWSVTATVDPFVRLASGIRHRSWTEIRDLLVAARCLLRGRAPANESGAPR